MKETGIIMSGNHPKLILDGIKTMTRRTYGLELINKTPDTWEYVWDSLCQQYRFYDKYYKDAPPVIIKCPYGQVGDRIWVKETFQTLGNKANTVYRADGEAKLVWNINEKHGEETVKKWRSSIFMPRWASRIERIITLLRVERLRDISLADAKAEGDYSVDEFIKVFLKLNRLPEDANPWNWVIGW